MQPSQHAVPRFGDWDDNKDLSYSIIFDRARADKESKVISSIDPAVYYSYHNAPDLEENSALHHQNMFNSSDITAGKSVSHSYHGMGNRNFEDISLESQSVNGSSGSRLSMGQQVSNHFQSRHPSDGRPVRSSRRPPSGQSWQIVAPKEAKATGDYLQVNRHPPGLAHEHYQGRPSSKPTISAGQERKFWESAGEMNSAPVRLARSQRSSESARTVEPEKSAVPRFGDWDASDASSGEGFTQMFNIARDEKRQKSSQKTSVQRVSPGRPDEDLYNPSLSQVPIVSKKKKGWTNFLCCINSHS